MLSSSLAFPRGCVLAAETRFRHCAQRTLQFGQYCISHFSSHSLLKKGIVRDTASPLSPDRAVVV